MDKNVWNQVKNLTADDFLKALRKDGWKHDITIGAEQVFLKNGRRISIHYHPQKTYGPNLLKSLLNDAGWSDNDLRRLKLIR